MQALVKRIAGVMLVLATTIHADRPALATGLDLAPLKMEQLVSGGGLYFYTRCSAVVTAMFLHMHHNGLSQEAQVDTANMAMAYRQLADLSSRRTGVAPSALESDINTLVTIYFARWNAHYLRTGNNYDALTINDIQTCRAAAG